VTDTTLEEARRCPRCNEPGELGEKRPVSVWGRDGRRIMGITPGAMLHLFYCRNKRCKWFNTPWEVQINPDGTIPPPDAPNRARGRLAPIDPALAAAMKDRIESVQEAMMRDGAELWR